MKLLLNECALKFETKEELLTAIKLASQMLDFTSGCVKACDCAQENTASEPTIAQPAPETVAQPTVVPTQTAQPATKQPAPAAPMPVPTSAAPVPTATPTYSIEEVMKAAQGVADAGGTEALRGLLSEFGVVGVSHLSTDQLGAFALKLRELGGNI